MTVSSATPYVSYECTGGARYYFTFKCYQSSHVHVTRVAASGTTEVLTEGSHYTVTLDSDYTGYITTVTSFTDGSIVLRRVVPVEQLTDWVNNDPLDANTLERSMDLLVMMAQQMNVDIGDAGALITAQSYATLAKGYMDAAEADAISAQVSATTCDAAVATVNLPTITVGDADKILQVKDDESGYELVNYPTVPDAIPVGAVLAWPHSSVPSGFLECDGSELSKTTYSDLFAVVVSIYGETDGAGGVGTTHFKLPDYRGMFQRGWDHGRGADPNRTSRTARGDGAAGDNVGTTQSYTNYTHYHSVNPPSANTNTDTHSHQYTRQSGTAEPASGSGATVANDSYISSTTGSDAHYHSVNIGAFNSGSSGGSEARPKNIYVMYIIKY